MTAAAVSYEVGRALRQASGPARDTRTTGTTKEKGISKLQWPIMIWTTWPEASPGYRHQTSVNVRAEPEDDEGELTS